jgi:hypothetical protein
LAADEISEEVRRFIAAHLVAVEQLEVLLLLHRFRRPWSAEEVHAELRTSPSSASERLEDLTRRQLLRPDGQPPRYLFSPTDPAHEATVAALANAYAERRYTVIELIFAKPVDRLRVYADAFRIKNGEDDG